MTDVIRNVYPNPPGEDEDAEELDTEEGTDRDNGDSQSEGMGEDESSEN